MTLQEKKLVLLGMLQSLRYPLLPEVNIGFYDLIDNIVETYENILEAESKDEHR